MHGLLVLIVLISGLQTKATESEEWERIRSMAETQHEIVMLLIKNGEYTKVPEASKKIFSLKFPPEQEHLLVDEGHILTDALMRLNQFDLAHQILDQAIEAAKLDSSKARLYKEKAYLLKKQGKDDEAMGLFEKALKLEESAP